MIEDQLNKDQRIRLEALNQANLIMQVSPMTSGRLSPENVIANIAKVYEQYIRGTK